VNPQPAIAGGVTLPEHATWFSQQHLPPAPPGQGLDQARASPAGAAAAVGAASIETECVAAVAWSTPRCALAVTGASAMSAAAARNRSLTGAV